MGVVLHHEEFTFFAGAQVIRGRICPGVQVDKKQFSARMPGGKGFGERSQDSCFAHAASCRQETNLHGRVVDKTVKFREHLILPDQNRAMMEEPIGFEPPREEFVRALEEVLVLRI